MYNKRLKQIFVVGFIVVLFIPLVLTNLKDGVVSEAENRKLASKPGIYDEGGTLNGEFISDFENWFNDNVGLRAEMVIANAKIQYYGFDVLANNSNKYLGPNGELNHATPEMLIDYQHTNLRTEKELDEVVNSYQVVTDYLNDKGISVYYFQCWDKHSIYQEQFPTTVNQYGSVSRTDQLVEALQNRTSMKVISPKEQLIKAKEQYDTYSVWGDPAHWTERGAYIGYRLLMDEINKDYSGKYKVLQEKDYEITLTDQGQTMFGAIHQKDYQEKFTIKNPQAYDTKELPIYARWGSGTHTTFANDKIENKDTLLIIGDSYFDSFLYDDLAESFSSTVLVWGDYSEYLIEIVDHYNPSIVVIENAERCDRSKDMHIPAKLITDSVQCLMER